MFSTSKTCSFFAWEKVPENGSGLLKGDTGVAIRQNTKVSQLTGRHDVD
jgi:hypothetical protein